MLVRKPPPNGQGKGIKTLDSASTNTNTERSWKLREARSLEILQWMGSLELQVHTAGMITGILTLGGNVSVATPTLTQERSEMDSHISSLVTLEFLSIVKTHQAP